MRLGTILEDVASSIFQYPSTCAAYLPLGFSSHNGRAGVSVGTYFQVTSNPIFLAQQDSTFSIAMHKRRGDRLLPGKT